MRIYKMLLICGVFVMLSACAASRKSMVSVSGEVADTIVQMTGDSTAKRMETAEVVKDAVADSSHVVASVTEKVENTETITEHITETADKDGNKTTTTDRTTQRHGSYDKQTSNEKWRKYQEVQTKLMLSRLDSIANSRMEAYMTHWAKNDSVNKVKKHDGVVGGQSFRESIEKLMWFLLFLCGIFAIWYLLNYRKHEK